MSIVAPALFEKIATMCRESRGTAREFRSRGNTSRSDNFAGRTS